MLFHFVNLTRRTIFTNSGCGKAVEIASKLVQFNHGLGHTTSLTTTGLRTKNFKRAQVGGSFSDVDLNDRDVDLKSPGVGLKNLETHPQAPAVADSNGGGCRGAEIEMAQRHEGKPCVQMEESPALAGEREETYIVKMLSKYVIDHDVKETTLHVEEKNAIPSERAEERLLHVEDKGALPSDLAARDGVAETAHVPSVPVLHTKDNKNNEKAADMQSDALSVLSEVSSLDDFGVADILSECQVNWKPPPDENKKNADEVGLAGTSTEVGPSTSKDETQQQIGSQEVLTSEVTANKETKGPDPVAKEQVEPSESGSSDDNSSSAPDGQDVVIVLEDSNDVSSSCNKSQSQNPPAAGHETQPEQAGAIVYDLATSWSCLIKYVDSQEVVSLSVFLLLVQVQFQDPDGGCMLMLCDSKDLREKNQASETKRRPLLLERRKTAMEKRQVLLKKSM